MNALWAYFWPCFAGGILVGALAGRIAFRRRGGRAIRLAAGLAAALLIAAAWHGPAGGAGRFEVKVEHDIHAMLVHYEMTSVSAHLHQHPLTRRVMLSGRADDFQRQGLVDYLDEIPGVAGATWSNRGGMPLVVEALAVSVLGFLFGLLLAYLVELRRRYNAQWNW